MLQLKLELAIAQGELANTREQLASTGEALAKAQAEVEALQKNELLEKTQKQVGDGGGAGAGCWGWTPPLLQAAGLPGTKWCVPVLRRRCRCHPL